MSSVLILFHRSTLNPRLELFAESLLKEGYEVNAVCWDRSGNSNAKGNVVPTTRVESPGFSMSLWNILLIPLLYLKFLLVIRRRNPDVLLCGQVSLLPLAVIVGMLTRTPVVYDVVEIYHEGYRSRDSPFAGAFADLVDAIERLCLHGVKGITVIDTADDVIAERYSGYTDNYAVIYNLPHVKPLPEDKDDEEPTTIVYAGLVDDRKGLSTLVNAFNEIHENYDLKLLIIGDSVDDTLERLKARAEKYQISDDVDFVGRVPYDEIHNYLLKGDIAVAPYKPVEDNQISRWNSRKIPDYMNASLPVVVPDFGGFPDIIEKTGCGITVNTGDPKALAAGIAKLVEDPELAHDLGQQGRNALETRYNWEQEKKKILEVVERVMS